MGDPAFNIQRKRHMATSTEISSVVKGHHVYKSIWTPVIEQELNTKAEDSNEHDRHAVAVMLDDRVVGHLPRSISRVSWFFLRRGGSPRIYLKFSCSRSVFRYFHRSKLGSYRVRMLLLRHSSLELRHVGS